MKTHTECIRVDTQVVEKAYPHTSCPVSFVGVDTLGTDGHDITRNQRQKAQQALAHNITEVVEWPCHWRITQDIAQKLVTNGRKKLRKHGTGCYSVSAGERSSHVVFAKKEEPYPLWATAGYWRKDLQGMHLSVRPIIKHSKTLMVMVSLSCRRQHSTAGCMCAKGRKAYSCASLIG